MEAANMVVDRENWVLMGVLGFMGGIASNILVPARRGLLGFCAAAFLGVFCGSVAGIVASTTDVHVGWQFSLAAFVGVFGDRILSNIMRYRMDHATHQIHVHGGQTQINQGENVKGDQS
jgi:hypothetical protein